MKNGEEIKAFVQVGLMKKPEWKKGTLVASNRGLELQELKDLGFKVRVQHQDEYLVDVVGNKLYLDRSKIKQWKPLKFVRNDYEYHCEEVNNFIEKTWEDLKIKCKNAVGHFFPEVELKINEQEKVISVEDQYGPALTVACGVEEKTSIVSFFEVPAWEVVMWVPIPATRHEPEDVDERNCGYSQTTIGAAKLLVDNLWRFRSEGYWQEVSDSELGEEW